MKIYGISPMGSNYVRKNNKNVSFGQFTDDNARDKTREKLTIKDPAQAVVMQDIYDGYFKDIDKYKHVKVYTDKKPDKIKFEFDKEFIEENDLEYIVEPSGELNTLNDAIGLALDVQSAKDCINPPPPKSPEQIAREEAIRKKHQDEFNAYVEAEKQARIDNLAD